MSLLENRKRSLHKVCAFLPFLLRGHKSLRGRQYSAITTRFPLTFGKEKYNFSLSFLLLLLGSFSSAPYSHSCTIALNCVKNP